MKPLSLCPMVLCPVWLVVAACGLTANETSERAAAPGPSSTSVSEGAPPGSHPPGALPIDDRDVLTLEQMMLGRVAVCDRYLEESGWTQIEFDQRRITQGGYRTACSDAGRSVERDPGEARFFQESERQALLTAARQVRLREVDDCVGYDGRSFRITIEHPDGKVEQYTDGISFGCRIIAEGLPELQSAIVRIVAP